MLRALDAIGAAQMTKLNRSSDCGNSPKNKVVEDIGIALERGDTEFLSSIIDSETGKKRGQMNVS